MKIQVSKGFLFPFLLFATTIVIAQTKKQISLKDSLDRKLDLSDWIIDAHGFIPIPIVITEPALGGFGLALAPVFLKRNSPMTSDGKIYPQPPNITAGFGGYTANKSWFAGGGRVASIPKYKLRYKVGALYADINMSFYRQLQNEGEKEFKLNIKAIPAFINLNKQLRNLKWTLGIQYLFAIIKVKMEDGSPLPDFIKQKEISSNIGELGAVGEYDGRDNVFTPDHGIKAHAHINFSENFFGSDYSYQRLNSFFYWYTPIYSNPETGKNWISGFRFDYQQIFGDPPFYVLPYLNLRGVPTMRYQGKTNIIVETEQRWDFVRRWSAVFFTGLGKAFDSYSDFGDAKLVANYGAGFRYLIARKFKARMGIDIARGPENWAYYIVFGSSWLK